VATGSNATAYGVYNPSTTTTITSCNIHGFNQGVEVEGGTVSIASTAVHDNSGNGVRITSGTLNVTASDVYANSTGLNVGGGNGRCRAGAG
jgi:hypothetical protein